MPRHFEVESTLEHETNDVGMEETELVEAGLEEADLDEPFEFEDFAAMGIDPIKPTAARPGSEQKVLMLSARYAAGLPLWHTSDCYDHGPGENQLMGGAPGSTMVEEEVHFDLDEEEEVDGAAD